MGKAGLITKRAIGGKNHTIKKKKKKTQLWKKNGEIVMEGEKKVRSHKNFEERPGKNKAL